MRKFFGTVEDTITGKPISGATVRVLTAPAGSAVTIYSDDGITPVTPTGELTSDPYGYYEFYVADGKYCLQHIVNDVLQRQIIDVDIFEGSYADVVALDARVTALEGAGSATGTYNATSTTSVAIGTGSKSFTIQTGKTLVPGAFYLIARTSAVSNYMYGQVTSYNSGTGALVMNITVTGGSGTYTDWTLSPTFYIPAFMKAGDTATGLIITDASDSSEAGLRLPHGAAPSSPTNGDFWTTSSGAFIRINGTTYQLATRAGAETLSSKTLLSPVLDGTPTEDIYGITDGAAFAIDPANGSVQTVTLGANRTPTLTAITAGLGVLLGVNDGTAYTITLSGVTWITGGGVAPTLKTSGYTWISLFNVGGTIYAALVGDGG